MAARKDGTCSKCDGPNDRAAQNEAYCRACHAAYARAHRPRHSQLKPEARRRANCRSYTNVLVKRGVLKRQPCAGCGSPGQAHHPDYGNPRHVEWLCRPCHLAHHRDAKRGTLAA